MSRTLAFSASRRIEAEKETKHLGTASVDIDVLSFPHSKELDPQNVERLKRLYAGEKGWRPEELPNRIPACIERNQLDELLHAAGIPAENISKPVRGQYPKLEFPPSFRLECFRGRHRVEAARELRSHAQKRWIVDFYPAGMCLDPSFTTDTKADGFMIEISKDLRITLTDEYTNEKKPDDGEFYYKIRQFQGALGPKNPYFEMRWWARLASIADTKNKKQRLQQLLGHAQFGPAFDAFLKIPALYGGMRLSMVNKMICLKCHDVRSTNPIH